MERVEAQNSNVWEIEMAWTYNLEEVKYIRVYLWKIKKVLSFLSNEILIYIKLAFQFNLYNYIYIYMNIIYYFYNI